MGSGLKVFNEWWRNAVIYQVYPRSFFDTNGDGDGDLKGVIEQLPYLKGLGIDAIWLSPFYTTPNKDGGYDVSDPRDVDPKFGNLNDARQLINDAHAIGLKVIFDIVPNHFSSEHIWFKEALASEPGSKERARFHFRDGRGADGSNPPNNWNSLFNGPSWSRVIEKNGKEGQWYLHLFDSSQPDLNWDNPEVAEDFDKTLRFWLDMGLDGFRIDVAHGMAKASLDQDHRDPDGLTEALRIDTGTMDRDRMISLLSDIPFFGQDGVHDIYREWHKIFASYPGDRMTVAEAYLYPTTRLADFVRPDELSQVFNFDYMFADWDAEAIKESISRTISELGAVGATPSWVMCNHDSPRVVSRLGVRASRAFAGLTHALPGSLYIYQGEELGLPTGEIPDSARRDPAFIRSGGKDKGRDGARVPLPWKKSAHAFGFTTGAPWLPQMSAYGDLAVDVQDGDASSYLNFYKKNLVLRKKYSDFDVNAPLTFFDAPEGVVAFKRGQSILVATNTTKDGKKVALDSSYEIIQETAGESKIDGNSLVIASESTVWLHAK
jgi:alpha-glucosidase